MVRNYLDRPIEPAALDRIVEAGRRGPSAGFAQGCYLVVVTEEATRRAIAELAGEPLYVARGAPAWISGAPAHVVVAVREDDYHARYREPDKLQDDGAEIDWPVPFWFVDGGATLMLLLLAAVDEGLGAGVLGTHRLEGLRELLGMPSDVVPLAVVTLGHPAAVQPLGSARRGRKPAHEMVRRERWEG